MHLHDIGVLHNDIKANNVIIQNNMTITVKIIDFGKATLKSTPIVYKLNKDQQEQYNRKHRYLAHELRNSTTTVQSELTDTYSIGYMFKYIGYFENFSFLKEIGRKMKTTSPY